uniref:Uncharacterized protein n=1 Tax=uncultured prokaryote TaxID=198431 RepID=A0A0H5QBW0_9ZZZZ|nr:hypothetical protein [uncultured prokaryote]
MGLGTKLEDFLKEDAFLGFPPEPGLENPVQPSRQLDPPEIRESLTIRTGP